MLYTQRVRRHDHVYRCIYAPPNRVLTNKHAFYGIKWNRQTDICELVPHTNNLITLELTESLQFLKTNSINLWV